MGQIHKCNFSVDNVVKYDIWCWQMSALNKAVRLENPADGSKIQ